MKAIRLSYNQSKKLVWNNQDIKVNQNGMALYLENWGDKIVAKDWTGKLVDVKIKIDECFE